MKHLTLTLNITLIIFCFFSENLSGQWLPDVRLTNDNARSFTPGNNAWYIAANGETIHVVWYDDRDGNWEIYYKRSTNSGSEWGSDTRLTNNDSVSAFPSVCVSGSNVHIVCQETRNGNYEIYYKRSADGGLNWGADVRLTNNSNSSEFPCIAASGSNLFLVWEDNRDGNNEIYFKRSADGGLNWSMDTRLTNSTADSEKPSVSVSNQDVHVIWYDHRDGNDEIYYKHSINNGANWQADVRLTNNILFSGYASVWSSGSFVHCIWTDRRDGNYEIYYKRSTNSGENWSPDKRLTNQEDEQQSPSITSSGSNVHVVYRDYRASNPEIYYNLSTDNGSSWSPDTRLTNNVAYSYNPCVAVCSSFVHVVWKDNRESNDEIYYKRNPTGNPFGIIKVSTEVPLKFSLSQNYPNPFNPVTNINFCLPNSGNVKIDVVDMTGCEVSIVADKFLSAGSYILDFDASELSSGVYFYRMFSGDFADIKKMVLIK